MGAIKFNEHKLPWGYGASATKGEHLYSYKVRNCFGGGAGDKGPHGEVVRHAVHIGFILFSTYLAPDGVKRKVLVASVNNNLSYSVVLQTAKQHRCYLPTVQKIRTNIARRLRIRAKCVS